MSNLSLFTFEPLEVKLDNGKVGYVRRLEAIEKINLIESLEALPADTEIAEESASSVARKGLDNIVRGLSIYLCDKDGNRLYASVEEAQELERADWGILIALYNAALRYNGLSQEGNDDSKKK